ncbi:hypothetical protein [Haloferax sp. DFSO60]|uniref:hypothetical protein n=1 Tax=Haloferax sp. DFSO60 TaxID=3388652 RepID=UPI003978E1A6
MRQGSQLWPTVWQLVLMGIHQPKQWLDFTEPRATFKRLCFSIPVDEPVIVQFGKMGVDKFESKYIGFITLMREQI